MDRSRNVTAPETVTPPPEVLGRALAVRSMLDVVEPLAVEARAAVRRAEGHESHACARAKAETMEASVKKLRDSLTAVGLFT
jgi:hypothetical protein